jgi:HK97 family phage prohead protease
MCVGKDMLSLAGQGKAVLGIDEENSGATFVVTSNQQDRDGDVIQPKGIWLEEFKRNPVWFWNHQQEPVPIGTGWHPKTGQPSIWAEGDKIIATCFFDTEDPFAMKIFGKIKRKMLSMCSIGFVPLKMERLRDKANHDRLAQPAGYSVEEAELVEISITGVGSNRQALLVGRSFSPKARQEYGAKMKNRIKNLPTRRKVLGNQQPISQTEKPGAAPAGELDKSSAADVQHVAISKEKYPNQADAMSLMDKKGLNTDDVRETDADWEFHQFPPEELVPDSGHYEDLDEGIKAFAGQRVTEPASDLKPETTKEADVETEPTDDPPMDVEPDAPLKPSAQALMDVIAHACEQVQSLEEPDILAFYQDLLEEAKKLAKSVHPDLDLYDDSDEVQATEEIKDMDEGEMEESMTPYRHTRALRTKGMSRKCMKSIQAAAEHMDDVADNDFSDQKQARMLKTGCRYHAKELRSMVKEPEAGDGNTDPENAGMFDEGATGKASVLSLKDVLALATKEASGYDKLSRQVFGR